MYATPLLNLIQKIHHWVLPLPCSWCGLTTDTNIGLCNDCQNQLSKPAFYCPYCSLPLSIPVDAHCGDCLKTKPYFSKIIAPFSYKDPIDRFITLLKFHGQLFMAELLGRLLANALQDILKNEASVPDIIIPVPLHKQRYQQRGFNQALEIAKPIAKQLCIPLEPKLIIRNKNTRAQSELDAKERQTNIQNAFVLTEKIKAKHIVLVDDVVTTGNTVNELSKLLIQSGIERVDIWACTRVAIGVSLDK